MLLLAIHHLLLSRRFSLAILATCNERATFDGGRTVVHDLAAKEASTYWRLRFGVFSLEATALGPRPFVAHTRGRHGTAICRTTLRVRVGLFRAIRMRKPAVGSAKELTVSVALSVGGWRARLAVARRSQFDPPLLGSSQPSAAGSITVAACS